jgi:hypothetical protein
MFRVPEWQGRCDEDEEDGCGGAEAEAVHEVVPGEQGAVDCDAEGAADLPGGVDDSTGGPAFSAGTWSMTRAMIGDTVKDPPTPTGTMTSATSRTGASAGSSHRPARPRAMSSWPAAIMRRTAGTSSVKTATVDRGPGRRAPRRRRIRTGSNSSAPSTGPVRTGDPPVVVSPQSAIVVLGCLPRRWRRPGQRRPPGRSTPPAEGRRLQR